MRSFFSLSVSVVRCSTCARNSVFTASSSPTRLNSVAFLVLRLAREDCEAMLFFCLLTKYLWSFTMGFVFFTLLAVLCEFCLWEDVYSGSDSVGIDAYEWSWLTTTSCWDSIGESCSSSGLLKPRASSEKSKVTSLSVEQEKGFKFVEKWWVAQCSVQKVAALCKSCHKSHATSPSEERRKSMLVV